MKTLYRLDTSKTSMVDWRGRDFFTGKEYYTLEAIQEKATEFEKHSEDGCGSYEIVARTIDEATFTVTDTIIKSWSYWKEIGRYKAAKEDISRYKAEIEKLETQREKSKSERRKAFLNNEIQHKKNRIIELEKVLEKKEG